MHYYQGRGKPSRYSTRSRNFQGRGKPSRYLKSCCYQGRGKPSPYPIRSTTTPPYRVRAGLAPALVISASTHYLQRLSGRTKGKGDNLHDCYKDQLCNVSIV